MWVNDPEHGLVRISPYRDDDRHPHRSAFEQDERRLHDLSAALLHVVRQAAGGIESDKARAALQALGAEEVRDMLDGAFAENARDLAETETGY